MAAPVVPGVDGFPALGDLPAGPALDDGLDAVVCAWSARRRAAGVAEVLGGEPDPLDTAVHIVT